MGKTDTDTVIELINNSMEKGVSRLCLHIPDGEENSSGYHHGRCDVGSPWAKGTVPNFDAEDIRTDSDT